jgi:hypothetical protein
MAEPTVIRLKHPIEFGKDRVIEELAFRRGRIGDMKGLDLREDSIPWNAIIAIASRLSGQPTQVIEKLDEEDAGEVVSLVTGFYLRCLATGPTG